MKIGIIGGAGHIGFPMSLLLAKKHKVTIIDPSKNVEKIKKGLPPFFEIGLKRILKNKSIFKNLSFSENVENLKFKLDVIIITLGTPIDEWGNPITDNLIKISDLLSTCC